VPSPSPAFDSQLTGSRYGEARPAGLVGPSVGEVHSDDCTIKQRNSLVLPVSSVNSVPERRRCCCCRRTGRRYEKVAGVVVVVVVVEVVVVVVVVAEVVVVVVVVVVVDTVLHFLRRVT
jgi:hypothetical protein